MPYFQTLVVHVSVATALALFSAATEVKATEYQCNCDEFEKRLKEMSEQVSDLVKKTYDCSMLELSIATVPQDIKKLTADVKALQNRGQNTVSNLIHPVPRMSIDAVYKKVRELDEKLREMESERKSLRDAVGRMERDIQSERLERNSITDAVRAEVKNVTKLLAPEVQRTAAALPSMVAKMKRFYSAGRVIMRLLSPAVSLNQTANKDKFERKSIAVAEGETNETTTESHAQIHAADVPSHSTQQKFEMSGKLQENLYNGTALTIHSDVAKSHSHGQPNFTETALYSEALKNDGFDNVSEIEFVGQDTNFSISIRDSKVIDCMEYDSNNDNISNYNVMPCDGFRADVDFEGHGAEERMAPVSDDFTTHTWSMENVIVVMAEELQKLRKKTDDDALRRRVEQIEKNVDRMITNMTQLERPMKDEIEQRFMNISLRIKDTVGVLAKHNLTHLEDTIDELARNSSSIWQTLHNALNKMQQVQRDLSEDINNSNVGNNASFHSMKENLLLSVSQLSELNESLQRSLAESEAVLKGELEKLNSETELKVSQLSQTVQRVLVSLDELSESYNSSIVSTDMKLQARMDDLHQRVFNEIERLKGIMKKNAESPAHLPTLSGWHPDDAADCPGLDVLGRDNRLVLSTHNSGRYRVPHLPSDPLPVGSVVRFRCVPAGSHRLTGAAELLCLGTKRWSSKPPRCQPLLTLEQIMVGNSTNMTPSILYDGLVDEEWASSDDNGSLVVRPGANLRLKCLYPRKRGNVTWLHNGTFPRDAALAWVKEGSTDLGENAYMLEINRTSSEHSGTYRCETPEGRKNSITIKILEVTCQGPAAPQNGHVEMASPGKASVGSKARFHCSLGYELQGSNESTCLGSGWWSDLSQKCKKMALAAAEEARIVVNRKALTNCELEKLDPSEPRERKTLGGVAACFCRNALLGAPSFFLGLFPIMAWIRTYKLQTFLLPDVLGGISTAVLNVPQGLVLAIVAGVDPALGLYSSLYPTLVYVIMGTSPFVSMGMVPVSALMTGAVVQKYSVVTDNTTVTVDAADNLSTERSAADVAVTLTLLTGLIQVAMWILRLDQLAVIISPITGEAFLSGCSLAVIISQLPSVFGVDVKPTQGVFGAPLTLYHVSRTIPQSNIATSLLSLASFVVLLLAKGVVARKMRRFTAFPLPSDLLLVMAATLSSHFLELDTKHDVRVVGHIKSGFPLPTVPSMNHWVSLLPDAAAIAIVQFVVTYAMAELFGRKRRLKTDASQEMLAYGMSGVVGSFFLCLPAGSSLSRSVVLKDVGSMTQVSGLVSSVFVALTLYAFASLFRPVPECVLAVLIIVLLLPMVFKLRNLPKLWMISRFDFVLWSLGFVSVVFLNATYGLMVGILLGLLTVFLELSRQKGSRLQPQKPDIFVSSGLTSRENEVVVYKFSGPLCIATHHNIVADFMDIFKREEPTIDAGSTKLQEAEEATGKATATCAIVMDCSAIGFIDSCGLRALALVADMCGENNCVLYLASLQDTALRVIKVEETILEKIGIEHMTPTIQDAIALANCRLRQQLFISHRQQYI